MYHRFNEGKYPSTNIKLDIFIKHMNIIKENGYEFLNPNNFENKLYSNKEIKMMLITIDDAFKSFYDFAWPYLKKHKITSINNKLSIILDKKPVEAGIDPYNKLIDTNSDDNRVKI